MDVFRNVFKHQQEQEDAEEKQHQQQQRKPNTITAPGVNPTPTPSNTNNVKPSSGFTTTNTKNNQQQQQSGKTVPKIDLSSTAKPSAEPTFHTEPTFGQNLESPQESFFSDGDSVAASNNKNRSRSTSLQNQQRKPPSVPPPPPPPSSSQHQNNNNNNQNQQREPHKKMVEFDPDPTIYQRSRNPSQQGPPPPSAVSAVHEQSKQQQQPPKQEEKGFFGKLFSSKEKEAAPHPQTSSSSNQQPPPNVSPRGGGGGYYGGNTTNPPMSARSEAHSLFDALPNAGNASMAYSMRPANGNVMVASSNSLQHPTTTTKNGGPPPPSSSGHSRSLSTQGLQIPEQVIVNSPQNNASSKSVNNYSFASTAAYMNASANGQQYVDHIPIVAKPFIPATNAALRAQRSTVSVGFSGACTGALVWMEEKAWVITSVDSVFDGASNEYMKLMQLAIRSPCIPKHFIPEALFVCDTPEEHHGGVALLRFSSLYSHLLRPLCVSLSEKVCALHTSLMGYQIEVPVSRRIFDEDHIFGGSALSAIAVTVVQTRSEYVWRALPDLSRSVNAVTGAPVFDEVGDIVAVIVGSGAMLSATSCRTRWDFERRTLSHEADREFLKKDYQLSRLRLGAFVAHHHSASSANAMLGLQNQHLIGGGLDFDDVTITTLDCARALDEMFKSVTPGGYLTSISGGDGSRNKLIEVSKPGSMGGGQSSSDQAHANVFSTSPRRTGASSNNTRELTRNSAKMRGTAGNNALLQNRSNQQRQQQQEASAERKRLEEVEMLDPADDIITQENMFRMINQPSNAAMGLAATLPRLVRLGTLPTSWCLVHAMMACERKMEVQAGSVRMMQVSKDY